MDIKSMIEKVVKLGGDELYLKIGTQPLVRINDVLSSMDLPALIESDMNDLIETLLTKDEIVKFQKNGIFEANYFGQSPCNFRISLFHSQQSPVAYIKIINSEIPELKDLDLPASLANLLGSPKGILILAGPSRSGISTTMAALVEHMNRKYKRHILVIEDPIQYYFEPKNSIISQRQLTKDIFMVEQGINFAKRMDVDTLVIGDIKRDLPYKNIVEYVAGGKQIIICLQSLGVVATLEKFVYSFHENDRDFANKVITENLLAVISQASLPGSNNKENVPVYEVFIHNRNTEKITQSGKYQQLEGNISSAGADSVLFRQSLLKLVEAKKIKKSVAEAFYESYKGVRL